MTIFKHKSKPNDTNIEVLNLLIALKKLEGERYKLSEKSLNDLFDLNSVDGIKKMNYFHIITLLFYIGNSANHANLKAAIEKEVERKYQMDNNPFMKSELTCLFFDYMTCPFVSSSSQETVLINSNYATTDFIRERDKIKEHTIWFMNWDEDIDLEVILKKKEWGSSY